MEKNNDYHFHYNSSLEHIEINKIYLKDWNKKDDKIYNQIFEDKKINLGLRYPKIKT